jgi:twinkle protein
MKNQIRPDEKFIRHAPCNNCSSQDNLAIYEFHSYCFGCQQWTSLNGEQQTQTTQRREVLDLIEGTVNALPKRQINSETCKKFNYETVIYNNRY